MQQTPRMFSSETEHGNIKLQHQIQSIFLTFILCFFFVITSNVINGLSVSQFSQRFQAAGCFCALFGLKTN